MNRSEPALAARLTPPGRGAIATVRITRLPREGAERLPFEAANGRSLGAQPAGRIVFGHWTGDGASEEVVVCRTDEQTLEIHCHGGDSAVRRVLDACGEAGCQIVPWLEQLLAKAPLLEAECRWVLTRATSQRTAAILLRQASGRLRQSVQELIVASPIERESGLERLLAWAEFGRHLTQPWQVVLVGRPNVGKSSLINALVGYSRSIVYDQPGTTRDVVTAHTAFDGWPVEISDTAGIRHRAEQLEAAGIEAARRRLEEADCRLLLIDVSQPPTDEDRRLLAEWPDTLHVAHKSDLPNRWGADAPEGALAVSSLTGAGVDELMRRIVARLVPDCPDPDEAVPVAERQIRLLEAARGALAAGDLRESEECLHALLNQ